MFKKLILILFFYIILYIFIISSIIKLNIDNDLIKGSDTEINKLNDSLDISSLRPVTRYMENDIHTKPIKLNSNLIPDIQIKPIQLTKDTIIKLDDGKTVTIAEFNNKINQIDSILDDRKNVNVKLEDNNTIDQIQSDLKSVKESIVDINNIMKYLYKKMK